MLGKLIKNEFKANLHSIGMIYVVAACAVAIMAITYAFKVTWISALATCILIAAGGIAIILTFACVIMNFQKTLFGNQGYLSFTLPVTSGQLLAAKAITSFCWMLFSFIVAGGIFFGVYLYATAMVGDDVKEAIQMITLFLKDFPSTATIKEIIALAVLVIFIRIIVLISQLYFALTLANTRIMQKFKGFSVVIVFFVVFIAMLAISLILTNYVPLTAVVTTQGIFWSTNVAMNVHQSDILISFGLTGTIFNCICGVLLFLGTTKLMDTKINVK